MNSKLRLFLALIWLGILAVIAVGLIFVVIRYIPALLLIIGLPLLGIGCCLLTLWAVVTLTDAWGK